MPSVLISGAGIAGDTLAILLARAGWSVEVVEIAPALRAGGQTVDLRGGARDVLLRLGLLPAALEVLVPQAGAAWVDDQGRRLAAMPVAAFGGQGFVSKEELLRTDLARVLHGAAVEAGTAYRWADSIDELRDESEGVTVRFRSGDETRVDLVVGADGTHSRTRTLRFGPEAAFQRPLGLAHAWYTLTEVAATPPLDRWVLIHNAPGRRALAARPGHVGEQEIGLTFAATDLPPSRDWSARMDLLDRVFGGAGWRASELLSAARTADDFALDTYDQIHMPTWFDGRVVLLGDAAWCASPLSGLGTALALRGAACLADALGEGSVLHSDSTRWTALHGYEQAMRPRTAAAQKLIPGRVAMAAPNSRLGIRMNAAVMNAVQWPILTPLITRAARDSGHEPTTAHTLVAAHEER